MAGTIKNRLLTVFPEHSTSTLDIVKHHVNQMFILQLEFYLDVTFTKYSGLIMQYQKNAAYAAAKKCVYDEMVDAYKEQTP